MQGRLKGKEKQSRSLHYQGLSLCFSFFSLGQGVVIESEESQFKPHLALGRT